MVDANYQQLVRGVKGMIARGQHAEALATIERATAQKAEASLEHSLLIQLLQSRGHRRAAAAALKLASSLPIRDADVADSLAFFARSADQHVLSNRLYRQATALAPGDARFWFNLATSERSLGHLEAAAEAVNKSCCLDPDLNGAALLRSELSRATPHSNHVADLERRLSGSTDPKSHAALLYALAKELNDLGRHDEAFAAWSRGADARRRSLSYGIEQDEMKLARIQQCFPTGTSRGAEADRPTRHVFILGLPRSGTTLLERILGALPGVRSNNETNNFSSALMQYSGAGEGDVFERAARAEFELVGREYEALAAPDGHSGTIIEKLPFNYLYVGAIFRAIPDAAVIALRRHPVGSCFAMYRTLFGAAYPFSYRFDELARYFAAYQKLMEHWERTHPRRIIWVDYEMLVRAPGTVASGVAARCGLPWRDDALELKQNKAASLTASASQVRGEIYTSSADGWRHYRRHLEPLVRELEARGVRTDARMDDTGAS